MVLQFLGRCLWDIPSLSIRFPRRDLRLFEANLVSSLRSRRTLSHARVSPVNSNDSLCFHVVGFEKLRKA